MKRFGSVVLSLACLAGFELGGIAQSSTITTYAGSRPWPVNGAKALTQPIDAPTSVIPDAFGGFYIASGQHGVYRVAADGTLSVIASDETSKIFPWGLAIDATGNLFIADCSNHRILKVSPHAIISSVAGDGTPGFSGDGGPATAAQLCYPCNVAVDGVGNLFISDQENHRIRKVDPDGVISTVAGDGILGSSGDGGPAAAAQLAYPMGIAADGAGNLFVAQYENAVRKVSPAGIITTVAGSRDYGASDVAVDGAGNLFLADFSKNRIGKVTPGGSISTIVGTGVYGFSGDGGPATAATLKRPIGVSVDGAGSLFIADSSNDRIRKVDLAGIITTVAGRGTFSGDGGSATSAQLSNPRDVAMDAAGNLFIADSSNDRIRKVTPDGHISTVAGGSVAGFSGDGGPATDAQLNGPLGITVDSEGNLFIADAANSRVRKVTTDGVITTVAGTGVRGFGGDGGRATSAQLISPSSIAVDQVGNLFIADRDNGRVRKVNADGLITTVAGNGTRGFAGDGGAATSAQLSFPSSVAVDGSGNLFIAELYNRPDFGPSPVVWTGGNRVRKVTPGGIITTVAGNGVYGFSGDGGRAVDARLSDPQDVAVDEAGNLFIADASNNRIRSVTPDGIITTVAGSGKLFEEFSGDFGPAAAAQLNYPAGVAVDSQNNLYIADSRNNRIRKVTTLMGPVLIMDSPQNRVGESWTLKVSYGSPNSPVRLLGTSSGQTWEIPGWSRTDVSGSFHVNGKFAEGSRGSHSLRVEIGGVFSNAIDFEVFQP